MGMNLDYDLEALKEGLGKIDKNIKVFEVAIEKELATKKEYRRMIAVLEEKRDRQNGHNG